MKIQSRTNRLALIGGVAIVGGVASSGLASADTNIPSNVLSSGNGYVQCGGPGSKYECAGAQVRTQAGSGQWYLRFAAAGCTSIFDPSALPSNGHRTISGRITSQMFYEVTAASAGWVAMGPNSSTISLNIPKAPTSGYCSSANWVKPSLGVDLKSVSKNYHIKVNIASSQSGGGMSAISNNHEIMFNKNVWVS